MALLRDERFPAEALFISQDAAHRAGDLVMRGHGREVREYRVRMRRYRGQVRGYVVIAYFRNQRRPTAISNSDFERLENQYV